MKLELLLTMTPDERALMFAEQWLLFEERVLKSMVDYNETLSDSAAILIEKARRYADYYREEEDQELLDRAGELLELAKDMKQTRHSIAEIRKQRVSVQWHRKKVNTLNRKLKSSSKS